jgi:tripartite-type tricarboxylate transporter receptor subunit TctC
MLFVRTNRIALAAIVVLSICHTPVQAQQVFPAKAIRIISPFAAGGGNDTVLRILAPKLTESLKQQIIIDTRAGANGVIGTDIAAKSAPDGYTLVLIPSGHTVNATLNSKLPYDSIRDFTTVTLVGTSPLVLAVHPSVPARSVKELIAVAKARPGQLTYGSAGVGSSGHLAGAMFDTLTGTTMVHVPYKGMSLALTDVMGGQVSMTFGTSASVVQHLKSGRLRGLAVTGARRSPALPDLPAVAEAGVPGYEASLWYGIVGPARIPREIVERLHAEFVAALKLADVRERLASQGVEAQSTTPDEFSRILVADIERWARVIKRAGVKIDQ